MSEYIEENVVEKTFKVDGYDIQIKSFDKILKSDSTDSEDNSSSEKEHCILGYLIDGDIRFTIFLERVQASDLDVALLLLRKKNLSELQSGLTNMLPLISELSLEVSRLKESQLNKMTEIQERASEEYLEYKSKLELFSETLVDSLAKCQNLLVDESAKYYSRAEDQDNSVNNFLSKALSKYTELVVTLKEYIVELGVQSNKILTDTSSLGHAVKDADEYIIRLKDQIASIESTILQLADFRQALLSNEKSIQDLALSILNSIKLENEWVSKSEVLHNASATLSHLKDLFKKDRRSL